MNNSTANDKIKQFRIVQPNELKFKKATIGGYQCKEVEDYIFNLIKNMEQSQKAYNEKFEEHLSRFSVLTQERAQLQKQHGEYQARIDQLQAEIEHKELGIIQENEKLKATVKSLTVRLEQTKSEINANSKMEAILMRENEELKENIKSFNEKNEKYLAENSALLHERETLKKRSEGEFEKSKALQAKLDERSKREADLAQENERLHAAVGEHLSERGVLLQERDKLMDLHNDDRITIKQSQQEIEQLQSTIQTLQEQLAEGLGKEGKAELEKLTRQNASLSQSNKQLSTAIDRLKNRAEELKKSLEEQKKAKEKHEDAIKTLITAKRNKAMDTNMKLYQYKLYLESNLENAAKNIAELNETMENIKTNAADMYNDTKIELNL